MTREAGGGAWGLRDGLRPDSEQRAPRPADSGCRIRAFQTPHTRGEPSPAKRRSRGCLGLGAGLLGSPSSLWEPSPVAALPSPLPTSQSCFWQASPHTHSSRSGEETLAPVGSQSCSVFWPGVEDPQAHSPPPPSPATITTGAGLSGPKLHASSSHVRHPASPKCQTGPPSHLCSFCLECPSCLHMADSYSSFKTLFKWNERSVQQPYN